MEIDWVIEVLVLFKFCQDSVTCPFTLTALSILRQSYKYYRQFKVTKSDQQTRNSTSGLIINVAPTPQMQFSTMNANNYSRLLIGSVR